ncbi:5-formyltetrahydrofolate cyclo-ligase [Gracilibacillus halophilus YIM-C55.5]|uniref:5-formyltetrahydrofolate cyclo-ligase n=2 Tax=Gracilibacillus TaxID=74385 RepID=N4WMU8_9BACI|nr:5-formyltetrahydrofolate cyclo-ligase [Gracilibacillus halophilus YIM-C55.5]
MSMKDQIRKEMLTYWRTHAKREETEPLLIQQLFTSSIWERGQRIGCTISKGVEWNTTPIIEQAWKSGKYVALPKCFPASKQLIFYEVDSFNQLENTYIDLFEPSPEKTQPVAPDQLDIIIVPGIAFHPKGWRIGYGGGYYDRYLQHYHGITIGLAADWQLTDQLFYQHHDIPIDYICTETEMMTVHK